MLREEIMFNINKLHWYVSIVSTVAVALLTFILQNPNNIALITLFLVAMIVIEGRIYSITKSNFRISTYMEVFLEPEISIKWETYSYYNTENVCSRSLKEKSIIPFVSGINTACFLIGMVPYVFNCIVIHDNISFFNILLSFFNASIMILLFLMSLISDRKRRDGYIKHWKKVKEEIEISNIVSDEQIN